VLRRRVTVGVLVFASLVLITFSFRSTALDPVEGFGAAVLRPFEIAANRVARPFRDAAGWTKGVFDAKSENTKLKKENASLLQKLSALDLARHNNDLLRRELHYVDSPSFPQDFNEVAATVLTNPSPPFDQTITISAGSDAGIALEDVVVTSEGLVGQVTKVTGNTSKVMLITDPDSAVSAEDSSHPSAGGILQRGNGSDSLSLNLVTKDKQVKEGDSVITAGSPGNGQLPSIFPRDIPIGSVTSVSQNDADIYKDIQVRPYVDLSSLQSVLVLLPKAKAATGR
jgi:rod shape-determining protein MreC